jgi:hypothetical protein
MKTKATVELADYELNVKQKSALRNLHEALLVATEEGLLDALMGYTLHPDSINDLCDAVSTLMTWRDHEINNSLRESA